MTAFAVGTLDVSSKPPVRRNLWAGDGFYQGSTPWHSDGKSLGSADRSALHADVHFLSLVCLRDVLLFVLQPLAMLCLEKFLS